jgi:hypothetical protein
MVKCQLPSAILLVFATSSLFAGWYLQRPQHGLFSATIFIALGILLTGLAIVYFRSAGELAVMPEQRSANKHPIYRLWLPSSFISAKAFFWQLRAIAVIGVLLGVEFVALGILFLVYRR